MRQSRPPARCHLALFQRPPSERRVSLAILQRFAYEEVDFGSPLPLRERDRVRGKGTATRLLIQTKTAVSRSPVMFIGLLRRALTLAPPCAGRQKRALTSLDLCREPSASTPPKTNWG